MPVDTFKTSLQVNGKDGLQLILDRIKREGPSALFAGVSDNLILNRVKLFLRSGFTEHRYKLILVLYMFLACLAVSGCICCDCGGPLSLVPHFQLLIVCSSNSRQALKSIILTVGLSVVVNSTVANV